MLSLASDPLTILRQIATNGAPVWKERLARIEENAESLSVHVAIFVQPFLDHMLNGRKTVESRFSVNRCPPYNRVRRGDIILIKQSGGPIVGICEADDIWFYRLDPASWATIKMTFAHSICADDPKFWDSRRMAQYAPLLRSRHVCRVASVEI